MDCSKFSFPRDALHSMSSNKCLVSCESFAQASLLALFAPHTFAGYYMSTHRCSAQERERKKKKDCRHWHWLFCLSLSLSLISLLEQFVAWPVLKEASLFVIQSVRRERRGCCLLLGCFTAVTGKKMQQHSYKFTCEKWTGRHTHTQNLIRRGEEEEEEEDESQVEK